MTNTSNFIIGESHRLNTGSVTPIDYETENGSKLTTNNFNAKNTLSIKTISMKNQNFLAPSDYVHLFSEKVLESTTGLTTLFIMPSSNQLDTNNTNNIQYMLPGIKTSNDNNYKY